MKLYWHKKDNQERLLLIFNGWGCDEKILHTVDAPTHTDVLLISDYTQLSDAFLKEIIGYQSIDVIAWSFGVFVANRYLDSIPQLNRAIAVAGTTCPISDTMGIPLNIFEATLSQYNESVRKRFFKRMFGRANLLELHKESLPLRSTASQQEELAQFKQHAVGCNLPPSPQWNLALGGTKDMIFPIESLRTAWGEKLQEIEAYHYTPFNHLITHYL